MLEELQESLASAIHRVFWVGTALSFFALLVAFFLPRKGEGLGTPTGEECSAETGERLVMAEFTTLEAEDEPVAARGD